MKKVGRKRTVILVLLAIVIIVEAIAFGLSRANNVKQITLTATDSEGLLADNADTINAMDDGASGYYIILPEAVNGKYVEKYIVTEKPIDGEPVSDNNIVENNSTVNNNTTTNKTDNTSVPANNITTDQNTTNETENLSLLTTNNQQPTTIKAVNPKMSTVVTSTDTTTNTVEKVPGDKIYLTQDELNNQAIEINVVYDTKIVEDKTLYKQDISTTIDDKILTITGYLPIDAQINLPEIDVAKTASILQEIKDMYNQNAVIYELLKIEILSGDSTYTPQDTLKISISNVAQANQILVASIEEDTTNDQQPTTNNLLVSEQAPTVIQNSEIQFEADELSEFALITIPGAMQTPPTQGMGIVPAGIQIAGNTETPWDGSVATSFKFGAGTSSFPYLITDGSDLAYLAKQVNAGTNYDGVYFQVTDDINLGGNTWTPIGTYSNSFRGIFDGAGHIISNAVINTKAANTANIESYGLFGSVGGGTTYAQVRNVELDSFKINLGTGAQTFSANSGYNAGFVVGTIYNDAKVANCIVKSSSMATAGTLTMSQTTTYVFLGGIAGSVGATTNSTVPATGHVYSIDNCYVSANIVTMIAGTGQYSYNLSAGGIVGRINNQPAWPTNCLYTGTINTHTTATNGGFIGPIFGSLIGNTAAVSPTNPAANYTTDDTVFSGTSNVGGAATNLTCTSYYTSYVAKTGTPSFNSTASNCTSGATPLDTAHRITAPATAVSYDMSRYQGVNKGTYTSDMNSMLTMFNGNTGGGDYVSWQYNLLSGGFTFKNRLTGTVKETNLDTYEAQITDNYNIGNYTYKWYLDGTLDNGVTGSTYTIDTIAAKGKGLDVVIGDGAYYTVVKGIINLDVSISFNINTSTNTVTASLSGTDASEVNTSDCTFTWYIVDASDITSDPIDGVDSLTLTGLIAGNKYQLVITNNATSEVVTQNDFTYGTRTIIYVSYAANATYGYPAGNNNNNGLTPTTPVQTLVNAYTKLSATGTTGSNIIIIMGNYTETSYLNSAGVNYNDTNYSKQATITGVYNGTDYHSVLTFSGTKYLSAPTVFQYMTLNGTGATSFYLQGNKMTFGEQVVMTGYPAVNMANDQTGALRTCASPNFLLYGGTTFSKQTEANNMVLPFTTTEIVIKSGTFERIMLRKFC
ncbi:MAG: hypothetical protein FWF46_05690 [Oscillospiraceae bacterium]|nr:hypothetical protein [Oscillospiraceae bacterium]